MSASIAWMTNNRVAANLLMLILLVGGALLGAEIKREIFPETALDRVEVQVSYPGAAPADVESSILLKIEEAISSLSGIKRISSRATEGMGSVTAELLEGEDVNILLQEISAEVDRISSFPEDALEPNVYKIDNRSQVIDLILAGNQPEATLRERVEQIRDELLAIDGITQVELQGVRDPQIDIEVPEAELRRHNLSFDQLAQKIAAFSVDLPGGAIRSPAGDVLIRVDQEGSTAQDYAQMPVLTTADGRILRLGEIAAIRDGFVDDERMAFLDGQPAAGVKVYRVGDQDPTEIADKVRNYVERTRLSLPDGLQLAVLDDRSEMLASRVDLLRRNAALGLVLVMLVLGLFLDLRLAFWTTMGIPISFMGALVFLPMTDVSINMISLFAFILSLGIVVDDAIVVGENIYSHRQMGKSYARAAYEGALEVAGPVIFAILTTVIAFMPMFFIGGMMGKFIIAIPTVVITILLVSLIEALFILPAHLSGGPRRPPRGPLAIIDRGRRFFAEGLERFVEGPYRRLIDWCLEWRYLSVATLLVILLCIGAIAGAGKLPFTFMPKVDADTIRAQVELPYGTPVAQTMQALERLETSADRMLNEIADRTGARIEKYRYAQVGSFSGGGGPVAMGGSSGAHLAEVSIHLRASDERTVPSAEVVRAWRNQLGAVPGATSLSFHANLASFGSPVEVALSHRDPQVLEQAAADVRAELATYDGISDIMDSYQPGKYERQFELLPSARLLGLTTADLARTLRGAYYGSEALKIQRGRDEVRIMVRYPQSDRHSLESLEHLWLRNAQGDTIPLLQGARLISARGYSQIDRLDQRRVISVSADVDETRTNSTEMVAALQRAFLPELKERYPGLHYQMEGETRERRESLGDLGKGFALALLGIYALLAVLFRSYTQPVVVMCGIPFAVIGALIGHLLMGYDLSMMSLFGILALSGVVVNDSLILIDFINRRRREGMQMLVAVREAGMRRFRPILLTSLTTFFGLLPMIFETSTQARFLVPMAISLGFGIMFATAIILILIPCLYAIQDDILHF